MLIHWFKVVPGGYKKRKTPSYGKFSADHESGFRKIPTPGRFRVLFKAVFWGVEYVDLDPEIDIFSYFWLIFENSERRFVISEEFWSRLYKLDFSLVNFFKKTEKFWKFKIIPKNTKKLKFTNLEFLGWEKIEFIHSRPKFFADHESALRIFKNNSKIWEKSILSLQNRSFHQKIRKPFFFSENRRVKSKK